MIWAGAAVAGTVVAGVLILTAAILLLKGQGGEPEDDDTIHFE